jgi:hypothetical protein
LSPNGRPMATIKAFTADGLFINQNPALLENVDGPRVRGRSSASPRPGLN